jgi:hypothetical protein
MLYESIGQSLIHLDSKYFLYHILELDLVIVLGIFF